VSAIIVLIGFSLTVATGFLIAFLWAVKSGQYDDKYTPSLRILFDDTSPPLSVDMQEKKTTDNDETQKSKSSNKQIKHKQLTS
jgi:cbb3-type cytochrome oxidase maturation protein